MSEYVILVNELDEPQGLMEKMEAHRKGLLHRAFSVFILNEKGELLLQKRASSKYHSGGLWTNTCCSHPREGEDVEAAAHRRMVEEMGYDCPLQKAFTFVYKADFENNMTEHEYDHVFIGYDNQNPVPNPEEVEDYAWVDLDTIAADMESHPEKYTAWFRIVFERFRQHVLV
ncbi:MAG: isopentenyl-diphosphate Delta-isomerase [Cryomorphaceae bacterium]|nr:isopentenyl-diphosphate Delta-isomerase [Cryomorphaceae bacterium]